MVKYIGQGNENQGRPCFGLNVIGKAGRKYDKSRHEGHQGVQQGDADSFPCHSPLLADIAAEDGQRSDTDAQRKKGLSQRGKHGFSDARLHHLAKIRLQVKLQSGTASRQNHGVNGQNHQKHQQTHHHDLCNALHALLKAHGADSKAHEDNHHHEAAHEPWIGQHVSEFTGHCL